MTRPDLTFEPLHFAEKLHIINPRGTVGLVTLWSRPDSVLATLRDAGVDLAPKTSPIAAAGTLFGQGLRHLLRNLLHNPQIDTLLVLGEDKSGSCDALTRFFELGLEPIEAPVKYVCPEADRPVLPARIPGTDLLLDDLVRPETFGRKPAIVRAEDIETARIFLAGYAPAGGPTPPRVVVPLPDVEVTQFPSNVLAHTVVEAAPSEAWRQVVFRVLRFGERVRIAKGERIELRNLKVLITEPRFEAEETLLELGFQPDRLRAYQAAILDPDKPPDQPYTYGNRLRAYFGVDSLDRAAELLNVAGDADPAEDANPDARKAYVALWDTPRDLGGSGVPCLVSIFFRKAGGRIELTATFRTHNVAEAWLVNAYGLMAVRDYVAERAGAPGGPITIISHSIALDPKYLEKAQRVAERVGRTNVFREDPNGHFVITTDGDRIVLEHYASGVKLGTYSGRKPDAIRFALYRDGAISDINHAMYVGMQLERVRWCLALGIPYDQRDAFSPLRRLTKEGAAMNVTLTPEEREALMQALDHLRKAEEQEIRELSLPGGNEDFIPGAERRREVFESLIRKLSRLPEE